MQIGIYATYDRTNATASAVRLAGLAQSLSYEISYLAIDGRKESLHPYWDNRVLAAKKENIRRWVNLSLSCVWFKPHLRRYHGIMEGCQKRAHILVPSWHGMVRDDFRSIAYYDWIVCPSRGMSHALSDLLGNRGTKLKRGIDYVNWTSGVTPMRKTSVCRPGRLRLFVPVDSYTWDRHGAGVLATIDALLDAFKHIDVTLSTTRLGTKLSRARIEKMASDYFGRFDHHCKLTSDEQLGTIHEHDWVWLPDVRSDNGLPAQQALAVGVPVIAWDICPFNEVVRDGWTGVLIPCKKTHNWAGAPTATWGGPQLSEALTDSLFSEDPLSQLRDQDWPTNTMEDQFSRFWQKALDAI